MSIHPYPSSILWSGSYHPTDVSFLVERLPPYKTAQLRLNPQVNTHQVHFAQKPSFEKCNNLHTFAYT